ncbi:type II toxin-antitoxin system RelE/ParE family toxin [Roseateles chitinivorans]|uniref:type II toxin-antitoxin system RelE/ParE family toxin n=1 Tax=Roseateles chitinivorans TaxID=2917965 RepID=UPI0013043610|nr:type II toxin-antitoxin system RelE/ParE family toxin [Roseateles chitinivorans]
MRFALSTQAFHDLAAILDRIRAENPLAAERYGRLFRRTFGTLAAMPGIGTRADGAGTLEFTFQRNYRIVYRPAGSTIWITRVVHVARMRSHALGSG